MNDHGLPAIDFEIGLDDRTEIDAAPLGATWVAPIETPSPNPGDEDARAGRAGPAAPVAKPPDVDARRPIEELWSEPPRKRQLPKRIRIVLVGVGVLLVAIIAFGNPGPRLQTQAPAPLADDMVVSAEELKNRREVRPDDFRPHGPVASPSAAAPTDPPAPTASEALAERRARREQDPEDILQARSRHAAAKAPAAEAPWYEGPVYVRSGSTAGGQHGATASQGGPPSVARALAAAGSSIPAVLTNPVELRGGSGTVIARADGQAGALRGARFIGTASAGTGRVTVVFRSVLLADGQKIRVDGEAQDLDGAFGLRQEDEAVPTDSERGSVIADVAQETATDIVSDAIGIGIAGRAVDRYVAGSRARRANGPTRTVSLAAGTKLQIFLHEAVEVRE